MDMNLSKLQELRRTEEPGLLQSLGWQIVRHANAQTEQLSTITSVIQFSSFQSLSHV